MVNQGLSGLSSYDELIRCMDEHLAAREAPVLALFLVDIDQFKRINSWGGHALGDRVLELLAQRLRASLPEALAVTALGGDQFAIFDRCGAVTELATYAEHLQSLIAVPLRLQQQFFHLTASIGVAHVPDDGTVASELFVHADMAVHQAKRRGGQRVVQFHAGFQEQADHQFELERRLRRALSNRVFTLNYQPKISLQDCRIKGVEALVRWHDCGEDMSPQTFIPLAEKLGLMVPIGDHILEASIAALGRWQSQGLHQVSMAANLSAQQLQDEQLLAKLTRWLAVHQVDARRLQLEITEHAVLENTPTVVDTLLSIKKLGITIALDDFGTGFSSLQMVRQLPVDTIKVDRRFVDGIAHSLTDQAITQAVIGLAHQLGLSVVAEGVEQPEDLAFLKQLGCDEVQGFLHYHPLSETALMKLLTDESLAEV